jgi:diaminopropionate ammonia-lyase
MTSANSKFPFKLTPNTAALPGADYGPEQTEVLNEHGLARARSHISAWPDYAPTPLISLPGLAKVANVQSVHYKDESHRFGLKSFKPLGGAYAVASLLLRELPTRVGVDEVTTQALLDGTFREQSATVTVCAATDGNHGRSVAWGARMFGCRCVIFINEAVSIGREQAIAAYGAEVRRNPGSFDDAVRMAQETADIEGWFVIPDTSDGVVIVAPRDVTQGYGVMAAEAIEQQPFEGAPSHLFLQAGVGGMAAATCAGYWQTFGQNRPKTILVEPDSSACWFASLEAGKPVALSGDLDSVMGGLSCGEVSQVAWKILRIGADAALTIPDEIAENAMRQLADGVFGDAPLVVGESGVAGLAGFLAVAADSDARRTLGLDSNSRIQLFGTEGATDPETYAAIVGRTAEEVMA